MVAVWRVTTRCNLACPFCAFDRRLPFPRRESHPTQVMAFLNILAEYQHSRKDPVLVSWIGGEPLRWAELPRLSTYATSLGLSVSATTNGTMLGSDSVRRHILDHYSELTVSLDAPDSRHDILRSSPGLFGSLEKSVSALASERDASFRKPKIRINAVLLRSTIDNFETLAHTVAQWGADELTFNILGGRDRPEYHPEHRPQAEQMERFIDRMPNIRQDMAQRGLAIPGSVSYLDRLHAAALGSPRPVEDCGPGEQFLFIDEQGSVSPCSFTTETLGVPITGIRDANGITALADGFASARCKRRPGVCADCPSTHVFEKFTPSAA